MRYPFLIAVAALALPAAVFAAGLEPRSLSLDQALERAGQFNPSLRQAQIAVQNFAGALEHASVPVPSNPRVSLQTYEEERADGRVSKEIGIQFSQELWIAGQWNLRENAARSRLSAARQRLDYLSSSVAALTRAAFLRTLVAQRAVETAEEVLAANRVLFDFAQRRLEAGEANQLEVNTARIGLGRAQALVAGAEDQYRQAQLALAEVLWLDPAEELVLTGEIAPAELEIPDQAALLNRAVQRRGDLAAAAQEVLAAQEELQLARRQIIPNLQVFAVTESDINVGSGALVGLSFELPLLHRYGGERQQAAAELAAAQLERDTLQLAVRSQVLSAVSAYQASRLRLQALSDEVVAAASQNFDLAMQAFEAGELDAPALTSTQTDLINIRREYLDALNDLVEAGTGLESATGGLLFMSSDSTAGAGTAE